MMHAGPGKRRGGLNFGVLERAVAQRHFARFVSAAESRGCARLVVREPNNPVGMPLHRMPCAAQSHGPHVHRRWTQEDERLPFGFSSLIRIRRYDASAGSPLWIWRPIIPDSAMSDSFST